MSRGSGRLQRRILDALADRGPVLRNQICWDVAVASGNVRNGSPLGGIRLGRIERSFYSGFNRAVAQLIHTKRIARTSRKLSTLNELISLYPFKTTDLFVRELREKLLPLIPEYLAVRKESGPLKIGRVSRTETEEYLFDLASDKDQTRIRKQWAGLESKLFDVLAAVRANATRRDLAFRIIQRGRALFGLGTGSEPSSLRALLRKARATESSEGRSVYGETWALYRRAIPERRVRHGKLKKQIYAVADLWPNMPVRVKSSFLDFVAVKNPQVLELPGHKAAVLAFNRPVHAAEFSPVLHRLFHRNVFSEFSFLSLAKA